MPRNYLLPAIRLYFLSYDRIPFILDFHPQYEVSQLKIIYEELLCSKLTTKNVCNLLLLSDYCSSDHLKVNSIEYIRK